jgi:hypothetical protein
MDFITPYITDKFTAYLGDVLTTDLSMAVWLVDEYTKKEPIGYIKVTVKEGDIEAVKNLSGYYCFIDMATGNYTVNIKSDWYFPKETTVDISTLDPKNPAVEIELKPMPSYPFPKHATVVRGVVMGTNGPVANADIEVVDKTIKTITDDRGEFVLYFKGIKTEDITINIIKYGDIRTVNATVEEGKIISLEVISFP